MESVYGQVVVGLPALRITCHDLALLVVGYQSLKAVYQERYCKGIVGHVRVDSIWLIVQNEGELLCISQLPRCCALFAVCFLRLDIIDGLRLACAVVASAAAGHHCGCCQSSCQKQA